MKAMAQSLLSHAHAHHHHLLPVAYFSSPRRPFARRRLAAAPLVPAKLSVQRLGSHQHFAAVVRAMPPSGADAGKPGEGGSATETNPSAPPQPAGAPGLPLPNIPIWARWVLGSIFCLAIPLYRRLWRIGEEVGTTVEAVVEVVEEVAKVTKGVAEDIAEALPEDGNLKKMALAVEEVANEVIVDAQKAESIIHKVDEIKEELEALAEPIIKEVETLEKEEK